MSHIKNRIIMENIEADPRGEKIDPLDLTDEQFAEFCRDEGPVAAAVKQYESEQQVIGLLLQDRPVYNLEEFADQFGSTTPEHQERRRRDARAAGGGRPKLNIKY